MEVRTVKVDIEKILDDMWDIFQNNLKSSFETSALGTKKELYYNLLDNDRDVAHQGLITLFTCKLINKEELQEMMLKVDLETAKYVNKTA